MSGTSHQQASRIDEIEPGGACYREVLGWRDLILRRPLGLVLTDADTAGEDSQRHFVLKDGDALLAGVIAAPCGPRTVRLRQMWVRGDAARQGRGRSLLAGVELIFREEGMDRMILNARAVVRGFYEKCGYAAVGDEFQEVGIPHIRMERRIE